MSGPGEPGDERLEEKIEKAIRYGMSIKGAPYGWWRGGQIPVGPPAYSYDGPPPDPAKVRREGVFCAGLTNLMMRAVGRTPPQAIGNAGAGGTGAWWLRYGERMEPYRHGVKLPRGTVLFRRYRNIQDQGHIGVVLGNGYVLHSYPAGGYPNTHPGVTDAVTRAETHSWSGGYWEYSLAPEHWLG